MSARLGPSQPAQGADVIVRAVAALALAGLAVIHMVDLPAAWLGRSPTASVPAESPAAVRRTPEYSQRG
jgi:hypothetical protein